MANRDDLYAPIDFIGIIRFPNGNLPTGLRKDLPFFHGNNAISAKQHWISFDDIISSYDAEHEDIIMKDFVSRMCGEAKY